MADRKSLSPLENYEQAAFELAAYLAREEQSGAGMPDAGEEALIRQMMDDNTPLLMKKIDRVMKKRRRGAKLLKTAFRTAKIAATVLMVLNLGLVAAVALSNDMRVEIVNFVQRQNSSYLQVGMQTTGESIDIPADWPENYFPSYIPEGFTVYQYIPYPRDSTIIYRDGNDRELEFTVCSAYGNFNFNVEGATVTDIQINGYPATLIEDGHAALTFTTAVWCVGDTVMYVQGCEVSTEEVLKVARSVTAFMR